MSLQHTAQNIYFNVSPVWTIATFLLHGNSGNSNVDRLRRKAFQLASCSRRSCNSRSCDGTGVWMLSVNTKSA